MNKTETQRLHFQGAETPPAVRAAAPSRVQELCERGRRLRRLFDREGYEEAVACFHEALRAEPDCAAAHAGLSEAYAYWGFLRELHGEDLEGFYEKSLEHAQRAVSLAPKSAASHRAMAVALRRGDKADPERRKAEALIALELDAEDAENWYESWRAFGYRLSDPALPRALKLDPALFGAYHDMAIVLCEQERHEEALKWIDAALAVNPRHSLARYNRAMILSRHGDADGAAAEMRAAAQDHADNPLIEAGLDFLEAELG